MKRALLIALELVLFLVVFFVGSLLALPELKILPMISVPVGTDRIFVLDGLLLMFALYVVLALIGLARKRASGWQNPTIAFVLALVLGLLAKVGFKTIGG
jgi:uncharacterized membrane protein SirB2